MMSPTNRFIAVLYTVFGLGIIAIVYFGVGSNSQLANALRIFLATAAVFVAVHAVFRRSLPALLVAAGLAAWAVDAFTQQRILTYVGIALFLGGFLLLARTRRNATPRPI
jgi:hypothetical protein